MQAQQKENKQIKALLCQISPFHKDKKKTIDRVSISLDNYNPQSLIDIIIFPEMSFTGYNFKSTQESLPYAVSYDEGVDFEFAKKIAVKTKAYVAFGYIEKDEVENKVILYNSAAVINRDGKTICNYRKNHLYTNDKQWAAEGKQFINFDLVTTQNKIIKCTLGIGMDIMPKNFTSGQWQLANFLVQSKSEVLIFLTNWVDGEKGQIKHSDIAATYTLWIHRLQPIIKSKKTFLFLAANRSGTETDSISNKEATFYGSSCAIMFNPYKIIKNLDIHNEGYLSIETQLP